MAWEIPLQRIPSRENICSSRGSLESLEDKFIRVSFSNYETGILRSNVYNQDIAIGIGNVDEGVFESIFTEMSAAVVQGDKMIESAADDTPLMVVLRITVASKGTTMLFQALCKSSISGTTITVVLERKSWWERDMVNQRVENVARFHTCHLRVGLAYAVAELRHDS